MTLSVFNSLRYKKKLDLLEQELLQQTHTEAQEEQGEQGMDGDTEDVEDDQYE